MIGIIDPPRDEAVAAVRECHEAGVRVKMITGDHVITARTIGKEIGIGDGKKAVSGQELEKMSDEALRDLVEEYDVYARTSPEHKLRLVTALQANHHLCAMTGDGVNDAPALKKADIGIAMGIKGTEVAKDASEMVLTDDNFASIVNAIEEGRTVYDNIRKSLLFILPTNGAESLVLMTAILLGMVLPITPAQILWVNMVTAVTLALAIAFEPMEDQVMARPPRAPDEPLIGGFFFVADHLCVASHRRNYPGHVQVHQDARNDRSRGPDHRRQYAGGRSVVLFVQLQKNQTAQSGKRIFQQQICFYRRRGLDDSTIDFCLRPVHEYVVSHITGQGRLLAVFAGRRIGGIHCGGNGKTCRSEKRR